MHHSIEYLEWARELAQSPHGDPKRRRGVKAQGLAYERKLAKALKRGPWHATHGQWFEYSDRGMVRHCQTDLLFPWGSGEAASMVVVEAKLTDTPWAYSQLAELYMPVVRAVYGLPVRGVVVVRNLLPRSIPVHRSLREALEAPPGAIRLVQWLGTGPV